MKKNKYKKIYALLRRHKTTGEIQSYLGKPNYTWSSKFLHHQPKVEQDRYWDNPYNHISEDEKHLWDAFWVRLNSKKCPINWSVKPEDISEIYNPYGRIAKFTVK